MNCQISKDLSYHVEKLRSLIQNHKIAMLLLSNSIFYASISLRDPITYEPYYSCLRGANCSHFEVLNENTLNLLKRQACPICEEINEKYSNDDYLFEIISFLKKNNIFFESIMIDLTTGFYLPISKESHKIDFEYFSLLVISNEEKLKEKAFNYNDEKIFNLNNVFYVSLLNEKKKKIKFPVRLKSCKHIEFFDLEEIYENSLQKIALEDIQCPFCLKKGNIFEIYMDSKFFGISNFIWEHVSNKEIPEKNIQGLYFYPYDDSFGLNDLFFNNKYEKIENISIPTFIKLEENQWHEDLYQNIEKVPNNIEKEKQMDEEFDENEEYFKYFSNIPNKLRQIQELPYYEF